MKIGQTKLDLGRGQVLVKLIVKYVAKYYTQIQCKKKKGLQDTELNYINKILQRDPQNPGYNLLLYTTFIFVRILLKMNNTNITEINIIKEL